MPVTVIGVLTVPLLMPQQVSISMIAARGYGGGQLMLMTGTVPRISAW